MPLQPVTIWTVTPLETPRLRRRCPRCDALRPFASSGRFRVNANGRRLDVWLIYGCTTCDATFNWTVHERVDVGRLSADRLEAFHANCAELAGSVAFDAAGRWRDVEHGEVAVDHPTAVGDVVQFAVPLPVGVRVDRVLAMGFGLSRSQVAKRWDRRVLRRPVVDGLRVAAVRA